MIYKLEDYRRPEDVRNGMLPRSDTGDPSALWSDTDIDWAPAMNRIMADVEARSGPGVAPHARVDMTGRATWHFHSTVRVRCSLELVGSGSGISGGMTRMAFHGTAGLRVLAEVSNTKLLSGSLTMRSMYVWYHGHFSNDAPAHGIHATRPIRLDDVKVGRFPGRGIYLYGQPATYENVDASVLTNVEVHECGLSGIWAEGGDANCILFCNPRVIANGRKRVDDDGQGLVIRSKLGCEVFGGHGRNNHLRNLDVDRLGTAPARTVVYGFYSEHSEIAYPEFDQAGKDRIEGNALFITAKGEGSVIGHDGSGCGIYTSIGRTYVQPVLQTGGPNGSFTAHGDATKRAAGEQVARQLDYSESNAHGSAAIDLARMFRVHEPALRLWGWRSGSYVGPPPGLALTDHKHARGGGIGAMPRGVLVGLANGGTGLLVGTHNPRYEAAGQGVPPTPAAAALVARFPVESSRPGDLVLSESPGTAYPWLGWVCAVEADGSKAWRRYGEHMVGQRVAL